jgi:hypothetical protein
LEPEEEKMMTTYLWLEAWGRSRRAGRARCAGSAGQTTAEYALVLLGAAAIASLLIAWAASTDSIGQLMDFVLSHIMGSVK